MNRNYEKIYSLISHHKEFILLTIIALRARRMADTIAGLEPKQAIISDFQTYGLTERQYRTAKKNLQKWGMISVQSDRQGTVATLLDETIYDINAEISPDERRTTDEQPTTNKNDKKVKKEKKTTRTTKFIQPSPDEVTEYGKTIEFVIDGNQFVDYYMSRGWMVGKSKMKDWKAAVRTWKRNGHQTPQKPTKGIIPFKVCQRCGAGADVLVGDHSTPYCRICRPDAFKAQYPEIANGLS